MRLKQKSLIITLFFLFLVSCAFTLKSISTETVNKLVEADKDSLKTTLSFQKTLRNIARSVSASVVNIRVVQKQVNNPESLQDPFADFFRKFFGDRGFGSEQPQQPQSPENSQVLGSGFIISKDGYILTNAHVVANSKSIKIQTNDNRNFEAKLIGFDIKTDIALIKINPSSKVDLTVAPLGNSDSIEPGDLAVAIGNPFGLNGTMTFGIISAKGRNNFIEENAPYKNYIQTDVPVNPGNSGGPLLNIRGQVVGVNSAIYSTSGGSIGISFAIPINIAENVINQLLKTGHVTRGSIGVVIQPLSEDIANYNHIKISDGLLVNDISKGGPADKAGIQPGDIIKKLDGKPIGSMGDFVAHIGSMSPHKVVQLEIIRDGKTLSIPITLSNQSSKSTMSDNNREGSNLDSSSDTLKWKGMVFMEAKAAREQGFNVPNQTTGVIVIEIDPRSEAANNNGIKPGDMIVSINKQPIQTLNDLKKNISHKKSLVRFRASNGMLNKFVVL